MKRKGRMLGRTNKSQLIGCATVVRAGTESNGYPPMGRGVPGHAGAVALIVFVWSSCASSTSHREREVRPFHSDQCVCVRSVDDAVSYLVVSTHASREQSVSAASCEK